MNGRRLVDEEGYEGVLEVGLALSQLIPSPTKPDPLAGTYETDSQFYKEFLAEREVKPSAVPLDKQLETLIEQEKQLHPWKYSRDLVKQTPLLLHLKKQYAATPIEPGKKKKSARKKSKKPEEPAKPVKAPHPPQRYTTAKPERTQQMERTQQAERAQQKPPAQKKTTTEQQKQPTQPKQPVAPKIMARPKQEQPKPAPAQPSGESPAAKPAMKRLPKKQVADQQAQPQTQPAIHYSSSKGPSRNRNT